MIIAPTNYFTLAKDKSIKTRAIESNFIVAFFVNFNKEG